MLVGNIIKLCTIFSVSIPGPEAGMYVEVDEAGLRGAGIKYLGLQLVDTESQKIGHVFKVSYFCQIKSKQRIKLRK